jgi:hypothetical protein
VDERRGNSDEQEHRPKQQRDEMQKKKEQVPHLRSVPFWAHLGELIGWTMPRRCIVAQGAGGATILAWAMNQRVEMLPGAPSLS